MIEDLEIPSLARDIYRELIAMASATASALAQALGRTPTDCLIELVRLERLGLVIRTGPDNNYVAADPELALRGELLTRQAELTRAEADLIELMRDYRRAASGRTITNLIEVVGGREGAALKSMQMQSSARHEVLNLVKAPPIPAGPDVQHIQAEAIVRGVKYRVIVESVLAGDSGPADHNGQLYVAGEDRRVLGSLPTSLLICDRRLALIPLADANGDQSDGAVLIRPSGMLDALSGLFDLLWRSATSLLPPPNAGSGLSTIERRVLTLLVSGLTDRSIAHLVSMSERSVQRLVRGLMDRAQVHSRVQLGWQAAKLGWLPES